MDRTTMPRVTAAPAPEPELGPSTLAIGAGRRAAYAMLVVTALWIGVGWAITG